MYHTSYVMHQENITDTSKSGMLESTLSMGVLQEIIYIIYQIAIASWDIQLLLVLLSNRNHTGLTTSTYTITIILMN